MDRIFVCEVLVKPNEIHSVFKWMATGEKEWVTYAATQTLVKSGLKAKKGTTTWCDLKFVMNCFRMASH